jgi:hypothetical protein
LGDGTSSVSWGRAWIRRLRWAHLVPEALALGLGYRLTEGKRRLARPGAQHSLNPVGRLGLPPLSAAIGAVRVATSIWPFRTTCLVRSMVLARMLCRHGYPAEVVIGVHEEGVARNPRFAHAWVEVTDGPGSPGFSELVRLVP